MTAYISVFENASGKLAFSLDEEYLHLPTGAIRHIKALRPGAWEQVDEGEAEEVLEYLDSEQQQQLQRVVANAVAEEQRRQQVAAQREQEALWDAREQREAQAFTSALRELMRLLR